VKYLFYVSLSLLFCTAYGATTFKKCATSWETQTTTTISKTTDTTPAHTVEKEETVPSCASDCLSQRDMFWGGNSYYPANETTMMSLKDGPLHCTTNLACKCNTNIVFGEKETQKIVCSANNVSGIMGIGNACKATCDQAKLNVTDWSSEQYQKTPESVCPEKAECLCTRHYNLDTSKSLSNKNF
jgi:hypothetical protein